MRGQRGSNCDGGRSENGGGRRRGPAGGSGGTHGFPEGTGGGGGGGRGVSTYHTPSIPKSRGRLATRQIVVAGKARSSTVAAGVARKGRGGERNKKYRERGGERVRRADVGERERSKSGGNSLRVFVVRFPWNAEKRSNKRAKRFSEEETPWRIERGSR